MKIDTKVLKQVQQTDENLYHILLEGVRAYLGERNSFSLDMNFPGGIATSSPTLTMMELLKEQKILTGK